MNENTQNQQSSIVVSPETDALVEQAQAIAEQDADLKQETKALVEAIKKRAQAEIQAAEELTREAYLSAVRRAKEAIAQTQLIAPDRIEQSVQRIQRETQQNWQSIVNEIHQLGDRLGDAAKAAWAALTRSKS
ncbi:hypothetical protein [Chroococcidiopsis sp. TS-821]|uniref:hypothetical protein n=1 Tax=Chroococcidiopsis sp. TS-821 TaxID=1378066 RepID=UPI000CEE23E3|nr:hypothetical protein [Chroococcidiopsis sp. TS-821]PPS42828.1 hypothetical protein B1A85_14055 [Chroococcidiopsis sp. TS-821]